MVIPFYKKVFNNMKRGFKGTNKPLLAVMFPVGANIAGTSSSSSASKAHSQPLNEEEDSTHEPGSYSSSEP